jgi:hypothetical protein
MLGIAPRWRAAAARSNGAIELQTAAALENLAVRVYDSVLALPGSVSGVANAALSHVLQAFREHHAAHADTFNNTAEELGGNRQSVIDGVMYEAVVAPALAAIRGPADALDAATTVETIVAATYVQFSASVADKRALAILCAVAPVEAQHAALLRTISTLLSAGAPELVAIPPDAQAIPAPAGAAGFPFSILPLAGARRAGEQDG